VARLVDGVLPDPRHANVISLNNATSLPTPPNSKTLSFSTVDRFTVSLLPVQGQWSLSVISNRTEFALCGIRSEGKMLELKNSVDKVLQGSR
jgi:hypothetical protein